MRPRVLSIAVLVALAYGCATTAPPPKTEPEALHGTASWYGEEFAGRTTANGEIFDPLLLTAAHRTLPFGTVVDVTNKKTSQTVRVRVNDRGPYIGSRVIDLSYAAAQQIGLIEPGVGDVDIKVVRLGNGEREAPAPYQVAIGEHEAPASVPVVASDAVPNVETVPAVAPAASAVAEEPVVVDRVEVETQQGDVVTRRHVSDDGTKIIDAATSTPPAATPTRAMPSASRYVVQVGAFAVEANAKSLLDHVNSIGQHAFITHDDLYRVRIGPFQTRDEAVKARAELEANGISAMVVAE